MSSLILGAVNTDMCVCGGQGAQQRLLDADDFWENDGREEEVGHKQKKQHMQMCESEGECNMRIAQRVGREERSERWDQNITKLNSWSLIQILWESWNYLNYFKYESKMILEKLLRVREESKPPNFDLGAWMVKSKQENAQFPFSPRWYKAYVLNLSEIFNRKLYAMEVEEIQ